MHTWKKLLVVALLMLCAAAAQAAIPTPNFFAQLDYDYNWTDRTGNNNPVASSNEPDCFSPSGREDCFFDDANSEAINTTINQGLFNASIVVSLWASHADLVKSGTFDFLFGGGSGADPNANSLGIYYDDTNFVAQIRAPTATSITYSKTNIVANQTYLWTVTYDNTNLCFYVNTTEVACSADSGNIDWGNGLYVAKQSSTTSYFWRGNLSNLYIGDDVAGFNVTEYYNYGPYADYTTIFGSGIAGLTLSATNTFDSSSIADFNVTISNSTFSQTVESNFSTGQAFLENITLGNYTVNVSNFQFFNLSYSIELLNVNATIQSNLTQADLTVEAFHTVTGQRISSFNISLGSQTNETTNGTAYIIAAGGGHTLSWNSAGYFTETTSVTFQNLTRNYYRFNVSSHQLNITASVYDSGTTINNFTINLTRLSTDFTHSEINTTTTGIASFEILNGTYNVTITAPNYVTTYQQLEINATNYYFQLNFSLRYTNTFNITFYDEVTKDLIDFTTVSLDLISDEFASNYSTTNGTLRITLLTPEDYIFRYSALPDYPLRFSWFNLSNGTFNNIELYLLNSTEATNVTITVIDENTIPVENARVTAQRYDLATNSYIDQETIITNFAGQGIMQLELNAEYYKFIVVYDNVVRLVTNGAYVTTTTQTLQIVIGDTIGEGFQNYLNIAYNLSFNNATNNFVYTYLPLQDLVQGGCLYVYEVDFRRSTLVNSTCSSASSATIVLGVTPTNGTTYRADAFITLEDVNTFLESAYQTYPQTQAFEEDREGNLFILFMLTALFVLIGRWSIILPFILGPLPLTLWSYMGWIPIEPWAAMTTYALCLIVGVVIMKRN